jgi:hypothetical protein
VLWFDLPVGQRAYPCILAEDLECALMPLSAWCPRDGLLAVQALHGLSCHVGDDVEAFI